MMEWKMGIICAEEAELAPILQHVENLQVTEKAMLKFYEGTVRGIPAVLTNCGNCKVNAAIAAQVMADLYHVNGMINAGTAGGMDETVELFDTVISTASAYHDVAENILTGFHPYFPSVYIESDERFLNAAKRVEDKASNRLLFGKSVTGECFITDDNRDEINEKFAPLSVDMETASIAHVCFVNQIPFIAVRTITDTASHAGVGNFRKNCEKASIISKDIVLLILEELAEVY